MVYPCNGMDAIQPQKRSQVLIHATVCMNLKNIILSEMPEVKGHILFDSIYTKCSEQANSQKLKVD